MRQIETRHWRRITKAKAKKLYRKGIDIMVIPCKVLPENSWEIGTITNFSYYDRPRFENFLNEFCWYNCQSNELGKYPAFYERRPLRMEDLEK